MSPASPSANMLRSQTEPSTPLRNIITTNPTSANYSAPLRSRISGIHLPPQELSQVLSGMSSRRSSITRERPPSRRSGASSRRNSSGKVRPTIHGSNPRRLSDNLTIRRRKRSSTGIYYDSGYVGPVTKGFLRAFSRALLQENEEGSTEEEVYKALDEQHRRQSTSPAELINEFDYSLPLPSDDVMMTPNSQPTETLREASQHDVPEAKPLFKSYLERILDSKNRNQIQLSSMFDSDSPRDLTNHGVNAVINTSKFVIENTLSGLPEYSSEYDMLTSDLRLAEPVAFGNLSDISDSNDSSEKENRGSAVSSVPASSVRRSSFLDDAIVTPNTYADLPSGEINQSDIPRWESVSFEPSKLVTPNLVTGPFDNETKDNDDIGVSDSSTDGLISGHFTIDNEEIQDHDFYLAPSLSVNEEEVSHTPPSFSEETRDPSENSRPSLGPSLAPKRKVPTQESGALPKSLVRGIVSVASHVPTLGSSQSPPRKRPKNTRIPPSLMQSITSKSNEFLQQVMSDLGAYAGHRNSSQINIQDAVLYLNRIRSHGPSRSTIDNISILAQSVFPLELLVSLDNSLQESANRRLRIQRNKSQGDSNESIYSFPINEAPQESDSLKSDDNQTDYEWE